MIVGDLYIEDSPRLEVGNVASETSLPNQLKSAGEFVGQKCAASMTSYPVTTVIAAIAIGVGLGWLIKRR